MSPIIKKRSQMTIGLTSSMTNELRGCQSVRTTFKLSSGTINAVSVVAAHLGIKQKSLFDHLLDDLEIMESLAEKIDEYRTEQASRIQKTYVISRRSLDCLEQIARAHKMPRDMLVEISVKRLLPIIEQERQQHEKRKTILAGINKQAAASRRMLQKTHQLLGPDDQVTEKIAAVVATYETARQQIEDFIEKGKIIESFY